MKVVVICGATGTGKTGLAIELARKLDAEIIGFDSQQVYKDFVIGTAQPTQQQLLSVKHHLIGHVDPRVSYTAGDFRKDALQVLEKMRKPFAVMVGGTGFYLKALLRGMFEAPPSNLDIKNRLISEVESQGLESLHQRLKSFDPESGKRIHPNDKYRILRALEIMEIQGQTLTEIRKTFATVKFPYDVIKIGLRRKKDVLRQAIYSRTRQMIRDGLIQETKANMEKYGEACSVLSSIGYKETVEYLQSGESGAESLEKLITDNTMKLAKRQSTWFKADPEIHWIDPDEMNPLAQALQIIDKTT